MDILITSVHSKRLKNSLALKSPSTDWTKNALREENGQSLIYRKGWVAGTGWLKDRLPLLLVLFPRAPSIDVDLVVQDEGLNLHDYGIAGWVIYTPGHTRGSLSVLLDSGEAFVGDLAMNKLPLRRMPGLPVLDDDVEKVKESWRLLRELGVETVYPGHGKPFPIEIIKKALDYSSKRGSKNP